MKAGVGPTTFKSFKKLNSDITYIHVNMQSVRTHAQIKLVECSFKL